MKRAAAWLAGHRKLIVAVTGAALTLAVQQWGTSNQWVSLAILAASTLGVYQLPNTPKPPVPGPHP